MCVCVRVCVCVCARARACVWFYEAYEYFHTDIASELYPPALGFEPWRVSSEERDLSLVFGN